MNFDEILNLTANVFLFYKIARETIHDCSYARERIMSSVSPYSSILCTISITACVLAADGSGDTLLITLQEMAPSRGMRYLVKHITNKFHVATRNTSSPPCTHTLWNKDVQRKEGTTRTHGSMAHVSALGLVLLVYCSMIQQMGVETKARVPEEDRANTTTCMPGTYDKRWKAMLTPPKSLVT